jgi:hypothetical protein
MITSLVEPGGARPGDATRRVVILTMFAYTVLAALFAGAASIGAGLAVLALGMLFTLLIDMRQWRDIVAHDRQHAPPEPARAALPAREAPRAIAAPTPMKAITTTRLLPYARAQEPVMIVAVTEPAVVAAAQEAEPTAAPEPAATVAAKPASKTRRQPKKPKTS